MSASAFRHLLLVTSCTVIFLGGCTGKSSADPLTLTRTIPLPGVNGRIDHLALDAAHDRLFVAEIANGTVDVIDLKANKVIKRIDGLREPQGLVYLAEHDELVVASGGDGTVRFYRGNDLSPAAEIDGLDDADNVRIDTTTGNLVVGYGSGALAVIDPTRRTVIKTITLPSHPEGFQIDPASHQAYVNLPRSMKIAVVDLRAGKVTGTWAATQALENFPMALDMADHLVAVGFRAPGRFVTYDMASGKALANLSGCGAADDLFYDQTARSFYMLCGDGHVDVYGGDAAKLERQAVIPSQAGGRTGLFSQDGKLFVAASATGNKSAAVLVFDGLTR